MIFGNLSENIESELYQQYPELMGKIDIYGIDDGKRRTQAGKYHKSSIIELYLGFNIRNVKINVSDELAEEYQRFDMMESIDREESFPNFICILGMMCKLDLAFAKFKNKSEISGQFSEGKDIFGSAPACTGFVVASAEYIMGKVSVERKKEEVSLKKEKYQNQMQNILKKLDESLPENSNYLSLDILNSVCAGLSKSRIGDEINGTCIALIRYGGTVHICMKTDLFTTGILKAESEIENKDLLYGIGVLLANRKIVKIKAQISGYQIYDTLFAFERCVWQ